MGKATTADHPELKMVNPGAAAIDIGSKMHMAAMIPDSTDKEPWLRRLVPVLVTVTTTTLSSSNYSAEKYRLRRKKTAPKGGRFVQDHRKRDTHQRFY